MTLIQGCKQWVGQIFGVFMTIALLGTQPAIAQDNNATDVNHSAQIMVVDKFHEALLTAMKNATTWSYEERREMLAPHVDESFDFKFMARFASGSAWRDLDATVQDAVAGAFEGFTLANYAARFHGYSGQKFEFLKAIPHRRGRVLIRTQLLKANGDPVRLDYLLSKKGESWRIVDVFLDGKFSELALRRSEFAPILRDQGADGLIAALEDRAKRLAQGDDSAG